MVKTRPWNSGRVSSVSPAKEHPLIQAIYKGIEIEMEMHQQAHGHWKCDFTLIKHPERSVTIEHAAAEFPTVDLAREHALEKARAAIDKAP